MNSLLSRRDFLKLGMLSTAGLAFTPFIPEDVSSKNSNIARVAIKSVSVYSEPSDKSRIVYTKYRDELLNIYYEVVSEDGPGYNPIWYRVWRGYVHSGRLQLVKNRLNHVTNKIPETGLLSEITVPYSQSMRYTKHNGWQPLYRLYYGTVHWIVGLDEGPDGQEWYRIEDEADSQYIYNIPASHLRIVQPEELTPISMDIPPEKKRIEVSISQQTLTAYEYDNVVMQTKISSGIPDSNPPPGQIKTDTPSGIFNIQVKMPSKHMGDGYLTADIDAYELPGVPWVCFFEPVTGVATHGTYWHTNYGMTMSKGCVNMRTEEAKWLYRWTTPIADHTQWDSKGLGTKVLVL